MAVGRAARFGYDAKLLGRFLYDLIQQERVVHEFDYSATQGHGKRKYKGKYPVLEMRINGQRITASDARTIRRWQSGEFQAATLDASDRLLTKVGLSTREFEDWAEDQGATPILRDRGNT